MSDYRPLIELTSKLLLKRTNCFRILVITVILISLSVLITTILVMGIWPTVGLLLLIPGYSLYLVCDNHLLIAWRTQVMNAWKSKAVDLSALRQALTANKTHPQQSIGAMLESLPETGDLAAEQSISKQIRLAATDRLIAHSYTLHYKLIRNAVVHAMVAITLSWAALTQSWAAVLATTAVPVLYIAFELFSRFRKSKIVERENQYRASDDFDDSKYSQIINSQVNK
jgi:protein-S-isoprenylcysteine O-methyltransferase Ste14